MLGNFIIVVSIFGIMVMLVFMVILVSIVSRLFGWFMLCGIRLLCC